MANIIISCDTTVALTKQEINDLHIEAIPLNAIADGVEYHDTVDIDALGLCKLMRNGAKISTSTPTPVEIENYFDEIFERTKADRIIHFTISSKLSSMFNLFTRICNEKYGDKVVVVDSLSICEYIVNLVKYAKEMANAGKDVDEIVRRVNEIKNDVDLVFIPETLKYLKNGGRISPAIATLAGLIGVLPVLCLKDGGLEKKCVTRTAKKAYTTALEEWKNIKDFEKNYRIIVMEADCPNAVAGAMATAKEYFPNVQIDHTIVSLNVIAHTGPGTIGIGRVRKYNV